MRPALALAALIALAVPVQAETLTIFAAASLKGPLDQAASAWTAETGDDLAISYGGSSVLARQIQQGAPADVFLSAAVNWMDVLEAEGLIAPATRKTLWGNRLVLIAHDPAAPPLVLDAATDLAGLIGSEKLAMALVDSVPAGQYGKAALISLRQWGRVEPAVVQAEDVRGALALVASGEAAYGVVYATDIQAERAAGGTAVTIATFPADSHPPILYPGAVVAASSRPEAGDFLTFLASKPAAEIFAAAGFTVLP
jgi:molybdate transport system substrate-binding protein